MPSPRYWREKPTRFRLEAGKCKGCGKIVFPKRKICPACRGREFEELSAALAYAHTLSQERALGAAIRSGADNPHVTVQELTDGLDTYRIRAKAVGNPRLTLRTGTSSRPPSGAGR